ncbi:MAG TPA: group II intron maturase-specific domain-containing protein [Vicinamibacterales bacterium]
MRALASRSRCREDLRRVIAEVNPVLRGWAQYFRTGNAATKFIQIDRYVECRLHALQAARAIIYYSLASKPASDITIEISDVSGKLVRHMSSAPIPPLNEPSPPVPDFWVEKPRPLPTEIGSNRINWDIRRDPPPAFSHTYEINANPGETPASPEGALALPGVYTVKLTVDGKSYTQTVTVKSDPRSPATAQDLIAQHDLQMKITDSARLAWDAYHKVSAARAAVADYVKSSTQEVADAAKAFDAKLGIVGGNPGSGRRGGGGFGRTGGPPAPPNFVAVQGALIRQLETLDAGDMAPTDPMRRAFAGACKDLATVIANWQGLNGSELTAFNAVVTKNNLKPVPPASPALVAPTCPPGASTRAPSRQASTGGR